MAGEAIDASAALHPGPTCNMATFALSFMKLKNWGPSTSQTSWTSFNKASSWKVRFTCRWQESRSMPGSPVHNPFSECWHLPPGTIPSLACHPPGLREDPGPLLLSPGP